jgi:uncharacterized tellurite resistance protein B-like protein
MTFWDLFNQFMNKGDDKHAQHLSQLHKELVEKFPDKSDTEHIFVTCMSGLLARVIYIDFEVHKNEVAYMKEALKTWSNFDQGEVEYIVELAITETKELAGLDQRHFCEPLNEFLDNDQKFNVIKTLFEVAASDESVDHKEVEEIRNINKALLLEHKHFVSAKNHVKEHLAALK